MVKFDLIEKTNFHEIKDAELCSVRSRHGVTDPNLLVAITLTIIIITVTTTTTIIIAIVNSFIKITTTSTVYTITISTTRASRWRVLSYP